MTVRDRILAGVVGCTVLLGGFWFFALAPRRDEARTLTAQIATERQRVEAARAAAGAAQAARARYADDYATVARLGKAVPADDGLASLVYQLETAAQSTGVDFRKLRLDAQGAGTTAAPAPPASQAANVAKETSGGEPAAQPAPATHAGSAGLPPGAMIGPAGFPVMPFSFVFDGSFFDLHDFLRELDRFTTARDGKLKVSGRLLTLNGISLTAGRKGFPQVQAAISANAYVVPAQQGVSAGATPSAPAPAAAAGGSGGGGSLPTPTATAVPGGTP